MEGLDGFGRVWYLCKPIESYAAALALGCLLGKWPWPWGACWGRCLEGLDVLEGLDGFGGVWRVWKVLEGLGGLEVLEGVWRVWRVLERLDSFGAFGVFAGWQSGSFESQ